MANVYTSSTRYTAVAAWAASTVYAAGAIVRQLATPAVNSERCFRCSTAGTSGASEPSWTLTQNGTTADNTVTWTECTGQAAYNGDGGGTAWAAPYPRLYSATNTNGAGNNYYVASDHAETQAQSLTLNLGSTFTTACISVNPSTVPPTTAQAGASISVTGGINNITLQSGGSGYFFGISFVSGSGSSSSRFLLTYSGGGVNYFESCSFTIGHTNSVGSFNIGYFSGINYEKIEFRNCTFLFGSTGQYIASQTANDTYVGCTFAASGAVPTNLFQSYSQTNNQGCFGETVLRDCDLSALGSNAIFNAAAPGNKQITLQNCKLGSGYSLISGNPPLYGAKVRMHCCDSGGTNYNYAYETVQGSVLSNTAVYRNGGASNGTTPQSWKVVNPSGVTIYMPFQTEDLAVWNDNASTSVTATVYLTSSVALTNANVWLEVEYLGASGSPLGTVATSRNANILAAGTALTTDTSTWTGGLTNIYKIALSFTAAQKGVVKARLFVAGVTTAIYVDPLLTVQ